MNVVLIGFRATGKTTIGKELAKRLKKKFINTDALVEKIAGMSIKKFVKLHGWERFRELEKRTVKNVSKMDNCIIDTGGGIVIDKENVNELKKNGIFILLETDKSKIIGRLEKKGSKKRPSLTGKAIVEEVEELLKQRNKKYKKAADFTINTSKIENKKELNMVINKITFYLKEEGVI